MPSKNISILYILISFLLIGASVAFSINTNVTFGKVHKQNNDLRDKLDQIKSQNMRLKNEINQLTSADRIRKVASEKLELIRNDSAIVKNKIIILEKSKLK